MYFLLLLIEEAGSFFSLIYCFTISMISIVVWWIYLCMISIAFICCSKSCLLDFYESSFTSSLLSALVLRICRSSSSPMLVSLRPPSSAWDSPCALFCCEAASELAVLRLAAVVYWPSPPVSIFLRIWAVMSFLRLLLRCVIVSCKILTSRSSVETFMSLSHYLSESCVCLT